MTDDAGPLAEVDPADGDAEAVSVQDLRGRG